MDELHEVTRAIAAEGYVGGKEHRDLRAAVSEALKAADPIGLLALGAPEDEYDPEVGTILPRLQDAASPERVQEILHEEFIHWFGADVAGPVHAYRAPAAAIWRALEASEAV